MIKKSQFDNVDLSTIDFQNLPFEPCQQLKDHIIELGQNNVLFRPIHSHFTFEDTLSADIADCQTNLKKWFSDEFLNTFTYWFQQQHPNSHFLSTFAFSQLTLQNSFNFDDVNHFIAPLNINNYHWILIVKTGKSWKIYDLFASLSKKSAVLNFLKQIT